MNAGYVRLSRDDDKRNYVSIENQKLIISQFAAKHHLEIHRWYEDDGVSGYLFDRPGFNQMMEDLKKDIDRVIVKDFSRLGRHNAKVLLLLDEFQEHGKQLIVIDDHYDSLKPDDDTIGIKTWYNERYVKDTSRKIKHALEARQKAGTLRTQPPFGYKRNKADPLLLEIVPQESECVKLIYDLYLMGFGYRKIADYLTQQGTPTPSMMRREKELKEGKITRRSISLKWSDSMVKDILDNDFYIGTLRLHKRARSTVHGKDRRVPVNEQYVFENNHPAIIDKTSFELVQSVKDKRIRNSYRGSHRSWNCKNTGAQDRKSPGAANSTESINPFGSCLFCKDCRKRLTPVRRTTSGKEHRYYICTTYNTKGKRFCSRSHLIEENELMSDIISYLKFCRDTFYEEIDRYDLKDSHTERKTTEEICKAIRNRVSEQKNQLTILLSQKIRDLSCSLPENETAIHESYDSLEAHILAQIHSLEIQLKELKKTNPDHADRTEQSENALQLLDQVIRKRTLNRRDMEILIERIEVDENGMPEIQLRCFLPDLLHHSPSQEMNRSQNEIIYQIMSLILENDRGYTSAKNLSRLLTDTGYPQSRKSVMPYINLMIDMGILEPGDNSLKPYTIVKTKEELQKIMDDFYRKPLEKSKIGSAYDHDLHGCGVNRWYAGNDI